ncbi:hypothetical protein DRO91_08270 [Candidatus Heimdallarchaeota archaeon]|nr:MAG: hypothetical protein DRO91_08270 [Candidatus Heimdallarchaeota archaeon]
MADLLSREEIDAILLATEGPDESEQNSLGFKESPPVIRTYEFPKLRRGIRIQRKREVSPNISYTPGLNLRCCTITTNMSLRKREYRQMLQAEVHHKNLLEEARKEIKEIREKFEQLKQKHTKFVATI